MKWIAFCAATIGMLLAAPVAFAGNAKTMPGKEVFLANKCNKCHTVSVLDIKELPKKEKPGAKPEAEPDKDTIEAPDLSDVGSKHDAAWIRGYLLKEIANDEKRKHKKKFKGEEADLTSLVEFLAALDTAGKSKESVK